MAAYAILSMAVYFHLIRYLILPLTRAIARTRLQPETAQLWLYLIAIVKSQV